MVTQSKSQKWKLWSTGLGCALTLAFTGCATGGGSGGSGGGGKSEKEIEETTSAKDEDVKQDQEKDEVTISGSLRTFTLSVSNSPLTSKTVNREKAAGMAQSLNDQLKNPQFKDRQELIGLMSVQAVAGITVDNMLETAQKLVNLEMSKDIRRNMPEVAKLQIVLSAIRSRNFAMAEHFMLELENSKNKRVRAGLLTAEGYIALMEDRIPEAVYSWNEALKMDNNYEPARLNIGFIALRYGDYSTATRMLSNMQDDWFAATGLMIAARLAGDFDRAKSMCNRILSKKRNYKPALLSCALNKYEAEKKYDEAVKMLQDVAKLQPATPGIDEKAFKLIAKIEQEAQEARQKSDEAKRKAQQKQAAEKALKEADKMLKKGGKQGGGSSEDGAPAEKKAGENAGESGGDK